MEFFQVRLPADALAEWLRATPPASLTETVPVLHAAGRVLAVDVTAHADVPAFARSLMDGYAVRAADTFGASATLPAFLTVVGEVPMGAPTALSLRPGEAALIHTGGMLPAHADAVVMVELTQTARDGEIEVLKAVAPGENVLQIGDDIRTGAVMVRRGHRLRPQDLGGLAALGHTQVSVVRFPRVAVLATGDEVVPPEVEPAPGQIRDVNTYAIAGLIHQHGGVAVPAGIAPDRYETLLNMAQTALAEADMLVLMAGSSVSVRDMTAQVVNALGAPGLLVHGVALKPGKPAMLGVCAGKPVVGLPGNPVSALVVAEVFVRPMLYHLQGATAPTRNRTAARLTRNIPSQAGRVDYVPVRLTHDDTGHWLAEPVFGKSNQIFTLVFADGLVQVPANATGLSAGTVVIVDSW